MRSFPALIAFTLALFLAACPGNKNVQCIESGNCDRIAGGVCHMAPSGNQWCSYSDPACPSGYRYSDLDVGDGVSGQCVEEGEVVDAGIDAVDAPPDGPPPPPIVSTNQNADLVLGQPDFMSELENNGGVSTNPTARSIKFPTGVASDGARLYVNDSGNARVLVWSPVPTSNFADAQQLLGKTSFTDGADPIGISASNIGSSCCSVRIAISNGRVVVGDTPRNRALIWNPVGSSNGPAATVVLGQNTFSTYAAGTSQSSMYAPYGVWTDGTRLAIADTGNHRVLIWNTFPTTNNQPADLVLGQSSFTTKDVPTPPTQSSLKGPHGAYFDGTRFYVADSGNRRVLIWNAFPTTNGQAADVVLGQPTFTTADAATTATGMRSPDGIAVAGNALFVTDTYNDRVLVFQPIPTASGTAAAYVLGQAALTAGQNNPAPSPASLDDPTGLATIGSSLYVVDGGHHRVVRFTLTLP